MNTAVVQERVEGTGGRKEGREGGREGGLTLAYSSHRAGQRLSVQEVN